MFIPSFIIISATFYIDYDCDSFLFAAVVKRETDIDYEGDKLLYSI